MYLPGTSAGKESACNSRDPDSIPGSRKIPRRRNRLPTQVFTGFPGGSDGNESACNAEDLGSIPELGRSPGGGHSNPLQYSCLENPHGQRSLVGCSPQGHKELDTTEATEHSTDVYTETSGWGEVRGQTRASLSRRPDVGGC